MSRIQPLNTYSVTLLYDGADDLFGTENDNRRYGGSHRDADLRELHRTLRRPVAARLLRRERRRQHARGAPLFAPRDKQRRARRERTAAVRRTEGTISSGPDSQPDETALVGLLLMMTVVTVSSMPSPSSGSGMSSSPISTGDLEALGFAFARASEFSISVLLDRPGASPREGSSQPAAWFLSGRAGCRPSPASRLWKPCCSGAAALASAASGRLARIRRDGRPCPCDWVLRTPSSAASRLQTVPTTVFTLTWCSAWRLTVRDLSQPRSHAAAPGRCSAAQRCLGRGLARAQNVAPAAVLQGCSGDCLLRSLLQLSLEWPANEERSPYKLAPVSLRASGWADPLSAKSPLHTLVIGTVVPNNPHRSPASR